jgi:LDH2 family malate/lactate/ureidoglycolate dehydrogenase
MNSINKGLQDLTDQQFMTMLKAEFQKTKKTKTKKRQLTKRDALRIIKMTMANYPKPKESMIHIRLPKETADTIRAESKRNGIATNSFLKQYLIELQERINQKNLARQSMFNAINRNEYSDESK